VTNLLEPCGLDADDVKLWAVHPGGRAILDKVEQSLGLDPWQIQTSRDVLRDCGNMSSVTVLFVLARMLASAESSASVAAMAFGPGLVIEGAVLQLLPATKTVEDRAVELEPVAAVM